MYSCWNVDGNEAGFSLTESIFALFLLILFLSTLTPIFSAIQRQERLADKLQRASQLATDQLEAAHGKSRGVSADREVREDGTDYRIQLTANPDPAGSRLLVVVSFDERGKAYAVSYEAIVP
jgi:type II secretory pathway pseudopilin PulG